MNSTTSRTFVSLVAIVIFGIFIMVGSFLLSLTTPALFPAQVSTQAQQVDRLFQLLLLLGGAIFLLVQGLLLYSVLRFRTNPDDTSDGPAIHGNATLELVWTAIPSVIVLVLVILSYQVWIDTRTTQEGENLVNGKAVPIHLTAQRFAWAFDYTTPEKTKDGNDVVIKSDVLHTYVGQNVKVQMDGLDVIHSFWVPAFRVKQDVMPGRTTEIRFTVIAPEGVSQYPLELPIRCAELCGGGHGGMITKVIVHQTEEAYLKEFYDQAVYDILNPPADPVVYGKQLLVSGAYPCANCHSLSAPDITWAGNQAPSLNGIGDRAAARREGYTAQDYLTESLDDPHAFLVPGYGALMPNFQGNDKAANFYMSEADRDAIVAYLCTQTETGEPACSVKSAAFEAFIGAGAEATAEAPIDAESTAEATPPADEVTAEAPTQDATAEATPKP